MPGSASAPSPGTSPHAPPPWGGAGGATRLPPSTTFTTGWVRRATSGAWTTAAPESVLEARLEAADTSLRRMLGEGAHSPEMKRAADLARGAAERAAEQCA